MLRSLKPREDLQTYFAKTKDANNDLNAVLLRLEKLKSQEIEIKKITEEHKQEELVLLRSKNNLKNAINALEQEYRKKQDDNNYYNAQLSAKKSGIEKAQSRIDALLVRESQLKKSIVKAQKGLDSVNDKLQSVNEKVQEKQAELTSLEQEKKEIAQMKKIKEEFYATAHDFVDQADEWMKHINKWEEKARIYYKHINKQMPVWTEEKAISLARKIKQLLT